MQYKKFSAEEDSELSEQVCNLVAKRFSLEGEYEASGGEIFGVLIDKGVVIACGTISTTFSFSSNYMFSGLKTMVYNLARVEGEKYRGVGVELLRRIKKDEGRLFVSVSEEKILQYYKSVGFTETDTYDFEMSSMRLYPILEVV
jgi:hypothetical protein